jgi:hypothetical protein
VSTRSRKAPRIAGLAAVSCVAAATAVGLAGVAAATQEGMHGDPAAAAPFWRYQDQSEDCAEMAVADVVGQIKGILPTEDESDATAGTVPSVVHPGSVYRFGIPTDNADLPVLLKHYGIGSTGAHTTIAALIETLDAGRKVIAAVNDHALRSEPGPDSKENHFVVVTGIDTAANVVHVNDSSSHAGRDEQVSLATFEKAWGTSSNFAVLTD